MPLPLTRRVPRREASPKIGAARRPLAMALTVAALALSAGPLAAQPVFKCESGGRTTYQSQPCPVGRADTVKISSGPSQDQVEAAQQRLQKDKSRISSVSPTSSVESRSSQMPLKRSGSDCAEMSAHRERAFSRRNAALGSARSGRGVTAGSAGDQAIAAMQLEIGSIESSMRARGCAF